MEQILENVGPWHIPVFLLSLTGSLPYGLFVMSLSFMAPKMNYWCKPPPEINMSTWVQQNANVNLRCEISIAGNQTQKCTEWEYDHSFHHRTLIEEWGAVCDRHWMLATAQSCLMFGVLVGCFVFAHISDWYGRKKCYIVSVVLVIFSGFSISFSSKYWVFCVFRFLMAVGHGGKRVSGAITTESVGPTHRAIVTVGQDIGWCLGLLLTPLITYHIRDWVWLQRVIIFPEFIFLILAFFLDESPKWLLSAGRYDRTKELLNKIVLKNKLDPRKYNVDSIIEDAKSTMMMEKRNQKGTLLDLVRGWTILKLSIACWGQYAVIILLYYHMMYFIVDIGSDPYMGVLYMALLEFPITTAAWYIVKTFKRKPVYFCSYLLAIVSGVGLLFPSEDAVTIRMILANIGKMASMILYNCLLIHVSECFPTKVRSVALGSSAMASRIGAIVAPFLKEIGLATAPWVPVCVTIIMCIFALLLSIILPETFGMKLPDTFHEAKEIMRKSSSKAKEKEKLTSQI